MEMDDKNIMLPKIQIDVIYRQDNIQKPYLILETIVWGQLSFYLLYLATQDGWNVHQMGVKTTFLSRDLKENVFMC